MALSPNIVNYRQILGQILLTPEHNEFIRNMPDLLGNEWDGNNLLRPPWRHGDGKRIKELTSYISEALDELIGDYCVYCGMKFSVTSGKEIEHIAPKGNGRYPQFMFTELNLVHSCSLCNGFEKKEREEYWDTIDGEPAENYLDCSFRIVHPYFHDPIDHFEFTYHSEDHLQESKVVIRGISPEGLQSIATFKLDEEPLTTERAKHVARWAKRQNPEIETLIEQALEESGNQ